MAEREFRGIWIPAEVWLDKDLSALDKVIFAEIDSLDTEETHCFASNEYLAEFCQCGERSVSRSIETLTKKGYIEVVSFDGRKRVLRSSLAKMARQTRQNGEAELPNLRAINIDNKHSIDKENTILTDSAKESDPTPPPIRRSKPEPKAQSKPFIKPTLDEVKAYCQERKNNVNPETWFAYYESNGWKVNRNPMKDWKASIRYWESSDKDKKKQKQATKVTNPYYNANDTSDLQF